MNNMEIELVNGCSINEYFTATMQLRWESREEEISDGISTVVEVLQQMWQGSNGTQKWEDVPVIDRRL